MPSKFIPFSHFFFAAITAVLFACATAYANDGKAITSVGGKQTPTLASQSSTSSDTKQGAANTSALFKNGIQPSSITFTTSQVADIQAAIAQNYVKYYHSLTAQNGAAAYGHEYYQSKTRLTLLDEEWQLQNTREVLSRHRLFSSAIFVTVMIIIMIALTLTVYQFTHDSMVFKMLVSRLMRNSRLRPISVGKETVSKDDHPSSIDEKDLVAAIRSMNELELTTSGIKIKSQMIGLVMLVFSMGFFYLYLVHVYPISIIQTKIPNAVQADTSKTSESKEKK